MCEPRRGALWGLVLWAAALGAGAQEAPALLARSDVFAAAPASFSARLAVKDPTGSRPPVELEVFRSGDDKALIRFLAAKEAGKFFLRLGREVYFLAPGSAQPVRLDPAHRLQGAVSFDEILGLRISRDYRLERTEGSGALTVFHLVAASPAAPYPRVRWAVRADTGRPVRADLAFADGRAARVIEFLAWAEGGRLSPRRLRVIDALRNTAAAEIEISDLTARNLPEKLFELTDPSARQALPPVPGAAAGRPNPPG